MSRGHAILAPSAASRWLTCTPSARFEEQIPSEDSEYSTEGTQAHELAEKWLKNQKVDLSAYPDDMIEHVRGYVDLIEETPGDRHLIEQRVRLDSYAPLSFGHVDDIKIDKHEMYVTDLKYGRGVSVSAQNNPQLMLYGLGALDTFGDDLVHNIILRIYQPRNGGLSSEIMDVAELRRWGREIVRPAANAAISGEGDFITGEHCRFCRARFRCAAYFEKIGQAMNLKDKRTLSTKDIANLLTYGDGFAEWFKKFKESTVQQMRSGLRVSGFKVVEGKGRRVITDENLVVESLLALGVEDIFKTELKTITELEKLTKEFKQVKGISKNAGAPVVVPISDPRPDIGGAALDDLDNTPDYG